MAPVPFECRVGWRGEHDPNGAVSSLDAPRVPVRRERLQNTPAPTEARAARRTPWVLRRGGPRGRCGRKALTSRCTRLHVRKQIVHNIHVVSTLEQKGAIFVDDVDEVPEGSHVVFSAHGVSPMVVDAAAAATCKQSTRRARS